MADCFVSSSIGSNAFDGLSGTDDGGGVGPKETLAAAPAVVTAGNAVKLKRGDTWTGEQITMSGGPTPTQESERVTFEPYGSGDDPIIAPGPDSTFTITGVVFEADEGGRTTVTVSGVDLTSPSAANKFMLFVTDDINSTIKTILSATTCTIVGDFSAATTSQAGKIYSVAPLVLGNKSYVTIQNLRFTDSVALSLGTGAAVKFLSNTLDNLYTPAGYLISCAMTDSASLVDGNTVQNCPACFAAIGHNTGGSNITVSNNTVDDVDGDGINFSTVSDTIIEFNIIGSPRIGEIGSIGHQDGIVVDPATDVIIRYNTVSDMTQGIYQDVHVSGGTIEGSLIYGNKLYTTTAFAGGSMVGIMLDGLHASAVIQNIDIFSNIFGDLGDVQSPIIIKTLAGGTYSNIVGRNNIMFTDRTTPGSGWSVGTEATAAVDIDYGNYTNYTAYTDDGNEVNEVAGDPLLVDYTGKDATTFDMHLGSGSPCNDAGDPSLTSLVTVPSSFLDIDGVTRVKNSGDLGAFEQVTAATGGGLPRVAILIG